MKITKLAGAVAAAAVTFGIGAANIAPASAADNIKTFGEQERLNGPNSQPYIGYTVFGLAPSQDPVPHNGTLYSAQLAVDGFGMNADPMIGRFGARAESGTFYPVLRDASNLNMLYFDVVGPVPNSVVWNDGFRDILCWIPGEIPLEPSSVKGPPELPPPAPEPAPVVPPYDPFATAEVVGPNPAEAAAPAGGVPKETDPALVATPNDLASPPFQLTEAEVASPGYNR